MVPQLPSSPSLKVYHKPPLRHTAKSLPSERKDSFPLPLGHFSLFFFSILRGRTGTVCAVFTFFLDAVVIRSKSPPPMLVSSPFIQITALTSRRPISLPPRSSRSVECRPFPQWRLYSSPSNRAVTQKAQRAELSPPSYRDS